MASSDARDRSRQRSAPIEMSPEEFARVGHRLVDDIARFLGSWAQRPVNRDEGPTEIRNLLPQGGMPEKGSDAGGLFEEIVPLMTEHSLHNGHPRFLGYITSSAAPIGALADMLAAAVNSNLGGWQLSPLASEIEGQCVRWIAEILGFPASAGGLLVSGGNMANFSGFLAARRAKASEQIRRNGIDPAGGRLLAYVSAETHTWIQKAADLFGHGTDSIRWIPVDDDQRIDLKQLREQLARDIADGHRPFMLVGTAGTVGTGAVDPLPELAAIAREHDLWFHVDGAYGAFAVLAPDAPPEMAGIREADSVALDPHKWLYAPIEAGCVVVRNRETLPDAFSYTPSYYRFTGEEEDPRTNYYELGLQNTRGFRALKVWLGLRQVGRSGYARMIADDIRLTEDLFRLVDAHEELQAFTRNLSIATFRYVPRDLDPTSPGVESYLNELNEELLARLKASGEVYLSNAVVRNSFLLRTCIVNFRTSLEDIEALPEIVARHGKQVDDAMRPDSLRCSGRATS